MLRPQNEMREIMKRIPLKRVYQALNKRYFWGLLPPATIRWVPKCSGSYWATCSADPRRIFRHSRGRWIDCGKILIEMRLGYFASYPEQFVPVLIHEMIHGYLGAVLGNTKAKHGGPFLAQVERIRGCGARISHKGETK